LLSMRVAPRNRNHNRNIYNLTRQYQNYSLVGQHTHTRKALALARPYRSLYCPQDRGCGHVCGTSWYSRAAGGGLVDRLPVRGAFVAFLCVCTSVPALSWGQYRHCTHKRGALQLRGRDPNRSFSHKLQAHGRNPQSDEITVSFLYIVPRTGVADTCQTHYGQTGPTLHA
jgi:hypothetical protein